MKGLGLRLYGTLLTAAVLLLTAPALHAQTPVQLGNGLRVMTYNVRNGVGEDNVRNYDRTATAIRAAGARYVALQEIDSVTGRSDGADVMAELAARTGLHPAFARAIRYDGGSYGVGILSAEAPLDVRRLPLPGREEARVMLVAEFGRFVLACTHLSLTEADRMASLDIIRAEAARYDKPFLLAGDWNELPDGTFVKAAAADFNILTDTGKASYPAGSPTDCIDYIAAYRPTAAALVKRSAEVRDEPVASDHRPAVCSLQLKMTSKEMFYATPYLQNPTPEGITVMAQTRGQAHCFVEYGTDTLHLERAQTLVGGQAACHDTEQKIRLDGLTPGHTYYYRVCAREIIANHAYSKTFGDTLRTPFYRFSLPAADTGDFTALIFNDLHDYGQTVKAMGALADSIPHDFVICNGDCLPEPRDREHAIRLIQSLSVNFGGAERPIFFIRGNHEIRNAYSSGMPSLLDPPGGRTYGAFSWGDTRFVVLDCGEDKPDDTWVYYGLNDFEGFRKEQADFLEKDLKSKSFKGAARRILVHHIPLWGNTDDYQPCNALWRPLLKNAPFDLSCCAHTHEFAFLEKGSPDSAKPADGEVKTGCPFPVYIGGGPNPKEATVGVLTKKGKKLTFRVLDISGRELLDKAL